eukprot:5619074-Prymnesium_polylepis.1
MKHSEQRQGSADYDQESDDRRCIMRRCIMRRCIMRRSWRPGSHLHAPAMYVGVSVTGKGLNNTVPYRRKPYTMSQRGTHGVE